MAKPDTSIDDILYAALEAGVPEDRVQYIGDGKTVLISLPPWEIWAEYSETEDQAQVSVYVYHEDLGVNPAGKAQADILKTLRMISENLREYGITVTQAKTAKGEGPVQKSGGFYSREDFYAKALGSVLGGSRESLEKALEGPRIVRPRPKPLEAGFLQSLYSVVRGLPRSKDYGHVMVDTHKLDLWGVLGDSEENDVYVAWEKGLRGVKDAGMVTIHAEGFPRSLVHVTAIWHNRSLVSLIRDWLIQEPDTEGLGPKEPPELIQVNPLTAQIYVSVGDGQDINQENLKHLLRQIRGVDIEVADEGGKKTGPGWITIG